MTLNKKRFKYSKKNQQTLMKENIKTAPDISQFFPTRVKFLGYFNKGNTITLLKSRIDANLKLQPPLNRKKFNNHLELIIKHIDQ